MCEAVHTWKEVKFTAPDANLWDPSFPSAEASRRAGRPAGFKLHPQPACLKARSNGAHSEAEGAEMEVRAAWIVWCVQRSWEDLICFGK